MLFRAASVLNSRVSDVGGFELYQMDTFEYNSQLRSPKKKRLERAGRT